jgi:hypothetical protein
MNKKVKIFTNESIGHSQIGTLEKILSCRVECEIAMDVRDISPNIQFDASDPEIEIDPKRIQLQFNGTSGRLLASNYLVP